MDRLDKVRKHILESETFCFYPYLELSTNPAGQIKPCCYFGTPLKPTLDSPIEDQYTIGDQGVTFEHVFNSEGMKEIRRKLTNGERINPCNICHRDGSAGMRARSVAEYKNNREVLELVADAIDNDFVVDETPRRLELKPNNLCNLKCTMCNSYDSSQIVKELKQLADKHGGIEVQSGRFVKFSSTPGINERSQAFKGIDVPDWSQNEEIWESFKKLLPNLEVLSFAGGEPTIMPWVDRAIKYCVEHDYAKNISVHIASNFTNLNADFLELMTHFKKFNLAASIDGHGKTQEYCRFPSKWSAVENNFKEAKKYLVYDNINIMFNITVNLLNVMNLTDLLYWIEEISNEHPYFHKTNWPYNINLLWGPLGQRVCNLTPANKELAIQRLTEYKKNSRLLKEYLGLVHKIDLVIDQIQQDPDDVELEIFKNRVRVLDEHRNVNIKNYIPDLDLL
jgi:MoaA/NifB/PqqE/SkfB family radical SAM enzyme